MKSGANPLGILVGDRRPAEDVLDEVYRKYAPSNPFLPIVHFVDHATMGPEALVGLGLGKHVERWIAHHRVRPCEPPSVGLHIESTWRNALGRQDCHGDWLRHFETELETVEFPEVLDRWVPRFAHDVGALLFHGLIRTAHATRALSQRNTPARRGELARGLALWAIGAKAPPAEAVSDGSEGAAAEADFLQFARAGAAMFVTAPTFPHLHLVTGPMAYDLIAPYLDSTAHRTAARSFAGTHARATQAFSSLVDDANTAPVASFTERHFMALASQRDAHPIKLTEAALRAYEQTGDEMFLRAAGKALDIHGARTLVGVARAALHTWRTRRAEA